MATKRTGRPNGRPRKQALTTASPKRGRGRPKKPLAERNDRHLLAFVQAALDHPGLRNVSDNRIVETFAGWRHGRPIPTVENIVALRRGAPFRVMMDERASRSQPKQANGRRHQNAFHAVADDELGRPLRDYRTRTPDDPDRQWLQRMTLAWRLCLGADPEGEWLAAELAGLAGESAFYERVMRPVLYRDLGAPVVIPEILRLLAP